MIGKGRRTVVNSFDVEILDFKDLLEIEGAWTGNDFAALLDAMEYGDQSALSGDDLREMCIMSLQDREPSDAAYLMLRHVVGRTLREGQIRNLANEALEEKLWEEYVDPRYHEQLFCVASLLYAAHPRSCPKPDAVRVKIKVRADNAAALSSLATPPNEAVLVRLLADGMDAHAVLNRLFEKELKGQSFPNADAIIWDVQMEEGEPNTVIFELISSGYWLDPLKEVGRFQSNAHADKERELVD